MKKRLYFINCLISVQVAKMVQFILVIVIDNWLFVIFFNTFTFLGVHMTQRINLIYFILLIEMTRENNFLKLALNNFVIIFPYHLSAK